MITQHRLPQVTALGQDHQRSQRCAAIASRRRAERGLNLAGIVVATREDDPPQRGPLTRGHPLGAIAARRRAGSHPVSLNRSADGLRVPHGSTTNGVTRSRFRRRAGPRERRPGRSTPARHHWSLPSSGLPASPYAASRRAARSSLKTWSQNYFCTSRQRSIRTQARVSSTAGRRGHVWRTSTFRHLRCVSGCPGEPS